MDTQVGSADLARNTFDQIREGRGFVLGDRLGMVGTSDRGLRKLNLQTRSDKGKLLVLRALQDLLHSHVELKHHFLLLRGDGCAMVSPMLAQELLALGASMDKGAIGHDGHILEPMQGCRGHEQRVFAALLAEGGQPHRVVNSLDASNIAPAVHVCGPVTVRDEIVETCIAQELNPCLQIFLKIRVVRQLCKLLHELLILFLQEV
mmetsp:Transcript_64153/g.106044  ORF Transcript_64153/g.106044 Transcript_64153/m.106044 type:complete len:205 (+) Transcript_64153:701-1315(+)